MKKIVSAVLCICLLALCTGVLSSCGASGEMRREDGSPYLEGTYAHEDGQGERFYVFTKDLLVLLQVVDTEAVEFHFDYVIEEKESGSTLTLTYKGLVYGGSDPNVSTYVTGMRVNYAKNPTQTSKIEIGDGYIVVSGQKLILQ